MATGSPQLEDDLKLVLEMEQNIDVEMKKATAATDEYIQKNQRLAQFYEQIIALAKQRGDAETNTSDVQNLHLARAKVGLGEIVRLEQQDAEAKKLQAQAAKELEAVERELATQKRMLAQNMFAVTILGFGLVSMFRQLEAVTGDKLPAGVKALGDSLVVVASAASSGAMFGGAAGAGIAAIAAGILQLTLLSMSASPEIQKLNDTLDNLARKEEVARALATVHGWTLETARASLELARNDEQSAIALKELTLATEAYVTAEQNRQRVAQARMVGVGGFDTTFFPGGVNPTDPTRKDAAQQTYEVERQRAAYEDARKSAQSYQMQIAEAHKKLADGERNLTEALLEQNQKRVNSYVRFVDNVTEYWNTYQDRVIAINQSLSNQLQRLEDQRVEVSRRARADEADAWRQYNRAVEREASQLQTALERIDREQGDRLSDILWQYNRDVAAANEARAKNERDLAYEIYRIQRGMYQDLAELDFNYREDLYNANTRRERNALERRHIFESNQIRAGAANAMEDLLKRAQDEEEASKRRMRLLDEEYRHKREVILRDAQQARDDAYESYELARTLAEQRRQDQLEDIAEREVAEKAALDRQVQYARIAAEQQLASAKDNYNDQVAAAKKRWEEERNEIARTTKALEEKWEKERVILEQQIYLWRVLVGLIYMARGIEPPPDLWNPPSGPIDTRPPPRIDEIDRPGAQRAPLVPTPSERTVTERTRGDKSITMFNYGMSPREMRDELRNFFAEEGDI